MAIPYLSTSAMYNNNMYPGIAFFYQRNIFFVYELWHSIIVRLLTIRRDSTLS